MNDTTIEIGGTLLFLAFGVIITYYQAKLSNNDDL
tara:strand:- start:498 stop:602 length:105 start_codon:yes stop_codon:yes gene_type:complete